MKIITALVLLLAGIQVSGQSSNICPCSAIGLRDGWADSNRITCYKIPVASDAFNEGAGVFKIAVAVSSPKKKTDSLPLLYLHGGPGIATLGNLPYYLDSVKTWKQLKEERPLVFFDYRGTGFSEPDICPDFEDSLRALQQSMLSAEQQTAKRIDFYKRCRTQLISKGINLASFSSLQSAEDASNIRKALQIKRWNVYGVSHGTTVAMNMLRNHGEEVNAMILDSPYPPNAPWQDFVRPFALSFEVLEKKIAGDKTIQTRFPSLRKDFVKAVQQLNKSPYKIMVDDKGTGYPFTGNDFAWSLWTALLKPKAIPYVPLAIQEVANGNTGFLAKWVVAFSNPNSFGRFSEFQSRAILCYEGRPKNETDTKASLDKNYPDFSAFNIDFDSDLCTAWQPEAAGINVFEPVKSNVPVLILSGEYDPVCPPLFGELAASNLSNALFLTIPAASHAAIHVDDCTRSIAFKFLAAPNKKPELNCITTKKKISFITNDLEKSLAEIKK